MNNPPTTPPGQIRRPSINPPNAPVASNHRLRPTTPTKPTDKSTPNAPKKRGGQKTKKRYILRKRVYKKSGGKKTKKKNF